MRGGPRIGLEGRVNPLERKKKNWRKTEKEKVKKKRRLVLSQEAFLPKALRGRGELGGGRVKKLTSDKGEFRETN